MSVIVCTAAAMVLRSTPPSPPGLQYPSLLTLPSPSRYPPPPPLPQPTRPSPRIPAYHLPCLRWSPPPGHRSTSDPRPASHRLTSLPSSATLARDAENLCRGSGTTLRSGARAVAAGGAGQSRRGGAAHLVDDAPHHQRWVVNEGVMEGVAAVV